MATRESLLRWQSALDDMEQFGAMPSGQQLRQQLSNPQAQELVRPGGPLYGFFYGYITRFVTTPFHALWSTDQPTDPTLLAALQPVADAITALSPHEGILPQWDNLSAVVHAARLKVDVESMSEPTVDTIIADMLSSLRTTLLVSCLGQKGSIRLITEEFVRHARSFSESTTAPLKCYDLDTNAFVDKESPTTLSLVGFKYFANRDDPPSDPSVESLPESPPVVAKQFAAQAIVDFYTDWEEHYRRGLAIAHGCSPYDFQIDYFGDLNRMRQDYVHNRGVCGGSAHCRRLKWFSQGDLMIPTPQNYVELLAAFPIDELRQKPSPRTSGTDRVTIRASIPVIREFEKLAGQARESKSDALNEALSDWIARNAVARE
jgi:hypothetical protein